METPPAAPDQIADFLRATPTFAQVSEADRRAIAPRLERRAYLPGELVIREGDPGESLLIVWRGRLRAVTRGPDGAELLLNEVAVGECVGEIALLTGEPRTASVYAAEPSELLELSRGALAWLGASHPAAAAAINQAILQRLTRSHLNLAMHRSSLFEGLERGLLEQLRDELELRLLRGGETLLRQGEASDALYLIVTGRLRAVLERPGAEPISLGELRRGQSVGEAGVITGQPRSATVYAVRDSLVARLSRESFEWLLAAHPQAMLRQFAAPLIRLLGDQAARRAGGEVATIALIPAGPGVPLAAFAAQIAQALAAAGPTMLLTSARLDALLARPGVAQTPAEDPASFSIVRWLSEQESRHRYIIYQADAEPGHWSDRCLRQADRVVIVGDAAGPPEPGPVERALLGDPSRRGARRSLVLLHAAATERPAGVRPWLEARQIAAHYHARLDHPADIARVARLLTGRGVGVVLAGGGALGFSHIGALRALREAGVPIDLIGGTSAGGLIACQYAMGWDFATIVARNHAAIRHRFDYTLPIAALMAGAEMTAVTRELFGETRLEDLWLPTFCVTTNLTRASAVVHERGPIWKYTRASSSVPGILPPVYEGGDLLVDGGLLNNLPTDVLRQRDDCGVVFAIDIQSESSAPVAEPAYETHISGWQVLWRRLNPFARPLHVPSIGDVMVRVAMLNDARQISQNRAAADYYIALPAGRYGLLDFKALDTLVANGYRHAREAVAAFRRRPEFQELCGPGQGEPAPRR